MHIIILLMDWASRGGHGDKIDAWGEIDQVEKVWDSMMSALVGSNPQAFLDLVLPGCRFIQHYRNKLASSERQPDAIIEAWHWITQEVPSQRGVSDIQGSSHS